MRRRCATTSATSRSTWTSTPGRAGQGIELRGPQRWRIKANWKIGAENFAGDSYHTPHTHASVVDIGLFREPKASKRKEGALYVAGPGAGTTYKLPPDGDFAEPARATSAIRTR